MTQVTLRYNVPATGHPRNQEVGPVEATPYVLALIGQGIASAIDPVTREVIALGVDPADGGVAGEAAAAEASQTSGTADDQVDELEVLYVCPECMAKRPEKPGPCPKCGSPADGLAYIDPES